MRRGSRYGGRRRTQDGASAVEFALVSFVLFPVLFGIIEYGLWFNDSLNVRQGVREGARVGVVQRFDGPGCSVGGELEKLACRTENFIGAATGRAYVRVSAPVWEKGEPLLVCAVVRSKVMGLVPLPDDRLIRSMTVMSIEAEEPTPSQVTYTTPGAPDDTDWEAWCKA